MSARLKALLGTFVFFWIAPATVAGWIPWMITRWRLDSGPLQWPGSRWLGALMILAGAAIVVECFLRFALKGLGTPAPVAPTRHLVVSGLYRHVRNPMYLGVLFAIVGQALLFGNLALLSYSALIWALFFAFVVLYEEPILQRQFGAEYETYRHHVPRWWPKLRPWTMGR